MTLTPRQLEEVMHFVGYLKSLPIAPQLQCESEEARQEVIKNALKLLHKAGTFSDIDDPVEWQREVRAERFDRDELHTRTHALDTSGGTSINRQPFL